MILFYQFFCVLIVLISSLHSHSCDFIDECDDVGENACQCASYFLSLKASIFDTFVKSNLVGFAYIPFDANPFTSVCRNIVGNAPMGRLNICVAGDYNIEIGQITIMDSTGEFDLFLQLPNFDSIPLGTIHPNERKTISIPAGINFSISEADINPCNSRYLIFYGIRENTSFRFRVIASILKVIGRISNGQCPSTDCCECPVD